MASVWGELRRRNVVRVAVAYAIVGWLLIEIASTVFPVLQIPEWAIALVTMLLLMGFPLALVLSWAYELTPEGMKKTKSVPLSERVAKVAGRKLDFVIIGLLALAVGFMFVDNYLPESEPFAGAEIDPASLEPVLDESTPSPTIVIEEQREVLPNSVAVLPFDNLSPNADDAYFAAGLHDEILSQLAKLSNLSVISRTSVLRYTDSDLSIPEIAGELNVGTIMEGSVRYADDRVRITMQLIDAETDEHLWSETYDREFADIFAIESDVAMNIANALEAEFSLAEQESIEKIPTDSSAAYALYLRARSLRGIDGLRRAIGDLNAATELDPEFALAYAYRAWSYAAGLLFSGEVPVGEYERNGIADAERALALDPPIGLAHSALAAIYSVNRRWADARLHTGLAYQLSPDDPTVVFQYVRLLRSTGEYAASLRAHERWADLDPASSVVYEQLAVTNRYARNYDASASAARKAVELEPARAGHHVHVATAEAARGSLNEAVNELRIAEQLFGGNFNQVFRVGQMAMAYSTAGRREDAERMFALLEELDRESSVGEAVWALAHIALGEYDEAYQRLEAAMERPSSRDNISLVEIKANPWAIQELETTRFREVLSELWSVE